MSKVLNAFGDMGLLVVVVLLVPLVVIVIGAPVALLVRLVLALVT
jgi:hypothetical protein